MPNKFKSKKSSFKGKIYDSTLERDSAIWLYALLEQKKIKSITEQYKINVVLNKVHVFNHYVDFLVKLNNNELRYVEIKGFPTSIWRLKMKIIKALDPIPYLVNPTEKELLASVA